MAAITINYVVSDECPGRVSTGNDGRRSIGVIVEDDAATVGVPAVDVLVVRALVHFPDDDVVGDYQMESIIRVRALIYIEGDPAGPAVSLRYAGGRRQVAIMVDYVVIGGEIVAVPGANPGSSRGTHGVPDKTQMVSALAKESVTRIAMAVEI